MLPIDQQHQQQQTSGQAAGATSKSEYRVLFPSQQHRPSYSSERVFTPEEQLNSVPHLIPPRSDFAQAVLMGNAPSDQAGVKRRPPPTARSQPSSDPTHTLAQEAMTPSNQESQMPKSNLSVLLEEQKPRDLRMDVDVPSCTCDQAISSAANTPSSSSSKHDEADSASGPPPPPPLPPSHLTHSAPSIITAQLPKRRFSSTAYVIGTPPIALHEQCPLHDSTSPLKQPPRAETGANDSVRRCLSSKELGTLAPPSGSPYATMLTKRELLENEMTERLREKRDSLVVLESTPSTSPAPDQAPIHSHQHHGSADASTTSSSSQQSASRSKKTISKNEKRNRRRAAHNRAVVEELCEIVADLFVAESKLINPTKYGFSRSLEQSQVLKSVQKFVSALPTRYALGADTPSEVLLHMRLMAVARSDPCKAVVHFVNLDNDSYWTDNGVQQKGQKNVRLVTVACADAVGLLEYITKLLGTGGSRVLDADVMLSTDRIVLDRFVVEMNGKLRLDKLAQLIEAFLKKARDKAEHDQAHQDDCSCQESSQGSASLGGSGPLYFQPKHQSSNNMARPNIRDEIQAAVPLTQVLASPSSSEVAVPDKQFDTLKRHFSMPNELACRSIQAQHPSTSKILTPTLNSSSHHSHQPYAASLPIQVHLKPRRSDPVVDSVNDPAAQGLDVELNGGQSMRQRRPLVNRQAAPDLDRITVEGESVDFVTVPSQDNEASPREARFIPLIPFDELMLIETIGMGRVSTIYRAVWQSPVGVQMVALKVAMVNAETGDMSHVDELRREADIAARLDHGGVCSLVGVAADAE